MSSKRNKLDRTSEVWHDPKKGWESLNSKADNIESNTSKLTKPMEVVVNHCFTSLFGTKGLLSDIILR